MNPFRQSLSLRLLGISFLITVLTVLLISHLFSRGMGSQWRNNIQPHLIQYLSYVHNDVGSPPNPDNALALSQRLPVNIYIYKGSELEYATNAKPLDYQSLHFIGSGNGKREKRHDKPNNRPRRMRLPPDHAFGRGKKTSYLRVNQDEHTLYYELRRRDGNRRFGDQLPWVLLGLGSLLLAGYFIIKRQLSPIKGIKQGVSLMSQGDLQHRRIANEMLPDSTNKQRIAEDLDEMDKLIHEIMESERLQHHTDLHYQSVDLVALIQEIIENDSALIQFDTRVDSLIIDADDARIRILIRNLVSNAIQHGHADSTKKILMTLNQTGSDAVIEVNDKGPGIDAEHIAKLSEPFYRPDASRTRSTGGFGMGLTLVKRIVDTHGGSFNINSQTTQPSGTTVKVSIPIKRAHR